MMGVQSFGEKRVFRRTIGRLCRLEVRSTNQKRLLYWAFCHQLRRENRRAATKLAEGEELGSNLLHVG
jgi:hypothetical protein